MKRTMLSDLFEGVVTKRLTLVETITTKSNQHEFQGVRAFKDLLGEEDRRGIPARFVWISGEQEALADSGFMSWSNVRKGKPRAPEFHLYYSSNSVTELMQVGDVLFLALQKDGSLLAIVMPEGSTVHSQLLWLFGLDYQPELAFQPVKPAELDFAVRYILDELDISVEEPEIDALDAIIEKFGTKFPTTRNFSEIARSSLAHVSAVEDPDRALIAWMEREEQLFRRLERRIVSERIASGFQSHDGADVDGFIAFSLSVQNRRKSRAGLALENHLEAVFAAFGVNYSRSAVTENNNKPDFLFPDAKAYADLTFAPDRLTMLGSKSTAKDRWRQVLAEADRISEKHLLTLEPGISQNQTDEMQAKNLHLVIPHELHRTYHPAQQSWLLTLSDFLDLVKSRQGHI